MITRDILYQFRSTVSLHLERLREFDVILSLIHPRVVLQPAVRLSLTVRPSEPSLLPCLHPVREVTCHNHVDIYSYALLRLLPCSHIIYPPLSPINIRLDIPAFLPTYLTYNVRTRPVT
jgi:hypothetical protein